MRRSPPRPRCSAARSNPNRNPNPNPKPKPNPKQRNAARDAKGEVDPHTVWSQDTVNEAAESMATLPAGHPPSCHAKDTACLARLGPAERKDRKRRWWLTQRAGSAWLAARLGLGLG